MCEVSAGNISQLMDNDHLKVDSPTGGHKRKIHKTLFRLLSQSLEMQDADTDTDVPQPSIRRSARLQSKITTPSGSKDAFKSLESDNNSVPSADTAFVKSSLAVPSFLYHSRSDDGIQLIVDLNLKTSDWLKNMAKEASVFPNHPKPVFDSFRKEVESLRVRNSQKIISPDITAAKDASMNSHVQKEVITVSSSKSSGSKVDQKSELVDADSQTTKKPEIQFSDIISCPNDSLTSTTKVNQEAGGDPRRAIVENKEKMNSSEETALSREENALMTTPASDKGSKRKKPCHKSDNIHSQSHERILRGTKLFGAQIVEHDGVVTRRSSRLNSKAVKFAEGNH
ncbi:hypothetical protein Tco_0661770 [Tanacetum coccineum]